MTPSFSYTLLTDGPSDQALLPAIDWAVRHVSDGIVEPEGRHFDPRRTRRDLRALSDHVSVARELDPDRVLLIHRDAEGTEPGSRLDEIREAASSFGPVVPLVPVRMSEAWLLIDEHAIRVGAGRPSGRERLELPRLRQLESLPDPKRVLFDLLRAASGLTGRKRKSFNLGRARRIVAQEIGSHEALSGLPAFARFMDALRPEVNRARSRSERPQG